MARTDEAVLTRVTSRDGTEIAYWTSGDGPPLVLVHGTTADHTRWATLLPHLEPHVTVHAMDRRGRGASGDGPAYALQRECEDVAAVVDAVAESSGSAVDVLGHSYGGHVAFGVPALTPKVRALVLYEGWPPARPETLALPPEVHERMTTLLAEGRNEEALETFVRRVVRMPEEELAVYRTLPAWQARIAAAPTIPRESRGEVGHGFDPEQATRVTVPVLLMVGSDSPDAIKADYETVAAALPDVRVTILEGQQHIAIDLVPEIFAERVLAFLSTVR